MDELWSQQMSNECCDEDEQRLSRPPFLPAALYFFNIEIITRRVKE